MTDPISPPPPGPHRSRATLTVLALLCVGFVAYASQYVPHLTNNLWADTEFTGWTSAIAHRLVTGGHMYRDVLLPIPPGSLWILEAVERWAGRPAVLHEVWVCSAAHLFMALLAYAIASPLTSRLNALMVAGSTLAIVTQLNKELAYDHTAQVVAWASLALLVRALVAWNERRRLGWLVAAGFVAGLVSMFKQSTGVGAVAAGGVAIAWLALLELRSKGRSTLRASISAAALFGLAAVAGFATTLGALLVSGGSVVGFLRTVYIDGSALKGGWRVLLPRLTGYTLADPTIQIPLVTVAIGTLVVYRIVRAGGPFVAPAPHHLDAEARQAELEPPPQRALVGMAAVLAVTFATGILLLALRVSLVPLPLYLASLAAHYLPALGLMFAVGYFFSARLARGESPGRPEAFAALLVGAMAGALFHNASVPEVRIFYDNNAIVAVSMLALFFALEQAKLPWLRWTAFTVLSLSMVGGKMERWLEARTPVRGDGFWGGMYVSPRGREVLKAAARIRELAAPGETVLVLPEDVTLATLIGRPRPKLCGAVVFVDQYPGKCVADDLTLFESDPPKVIVSYPGWENEWQRMYRLWSAESPAGFFNDAVFHYQLPKLYKFDSAYPAVFWNAPDHFKVFVRKSAEELAKEKEAEDAEKKDAPADGAPTPAP